MNAREKLSSSLVEHSHIAVTEALCNNDIAATNPEPVRSEAVIQSSGSLPNKSLAALSNISKSPQSYLSQNTISSLNISSPQSVTQTSGVSVPSDEAPQKKSYIRPYKLTCLVRTFFEEAALRYAAKKRRKDLFPSSSQTTTASVPSNAVSHQPFGRKKSSLKNGRPQKERPTQPVNPIVYSRPRVPKTAQPKPQPQPHCSFWEEGDIIMQGVQAMRSQFTPLLQPTFSHDHHLSPNPLPIHPPSRRVMQHHPKKSTRGVSQRHKGVHPAFKSRQEQMYTTHESKNEDEWVDIEELSPPRNTYHLYRMGADGTSCTMPITVTPLSPNITNPVSNSFASNHLVNITQPKPRYHQVRTSAVSEANTVNPLMWSHISTGALQKQYQPPTRQCKPVTGTRNHAYYPIVLKNTDQETISLGSSLASKCKVNPRSQKENKKADDDDVVVVPGPVKVETSFVVLSSDSSQETCSDKNLQKEPYTKSQSPKNTHTGASSIALSPGLESTIPFSPSKEPNLCVMNDNDDSLPDLNGTPPPASPKTVGSAPQPNNLQPQYNQDKITNCIPEEAVNNDELNVSGASTIIFDEKFESAIELIEASANNSTLLSKSAVGDVTSNNVPSCSTSQAVELPYFLDFDLMTTFDDVLSSTSDETDQCQGIRTSQEKQNDSHGIQVQVSAASDVNSVPSPIISIEAIDSKDSAVTSKEFVAASKADFEMAKVDTSNTVNQSKIQGIGMSKNTDDEGSISEGQVCKDMTGMDGLHLLQSIETSPLSVTKEKQNTSEEHDKDDVMHHNSESSLEKSKSEIAEGIVSTDHIDKDEKNFITDHNQDECHVINPSNTIFVSDGKLVVVISLLKSSQGQFPAGLNDEVMNSSVASPTHLQDSVSVIHKDHAGIDGDSAKTGIVKNNDSLKMIAEYDFDYKVSSQKCLLDDEVEIMNSGTYVENVSETNHISVDKITKDEFEIENSEVRCALITEHNSEKEKSDYESKDNVLMDVTQMDAPMEFTLMDAPMEFTQMKVTQMKDTQMEDTQLEVTQMEDTQMEVTQMEAPMEITQIKVTPMEVNTPEPDSDDDSTSTSDLSQESNKTSDSDKTECSQVEETYSLRLSPSQISSTSTVKVHNDSIVENSCITKTFVYKEREMDQLKISEDRIKNCSDEEPYFLRLSPSQIPSTCTVNVHYDPIVENSCITETLVDKEKEVDQLKISGDGIKNCNDGVIISTEEVPVSITEREDGEKGKDEDWKSDIETEDEGQSSDKRDRDDKDENSDKEAIDCEQDRTDCWKSDKEAKENETEEWKLCFEASAEHQALISDFIIDTAKPLWQQRYESIMQEIIHEFRVMGERKSKCLFTEIKVLDKENEKRKCEYEHISSEKQSEVEESLQVSSKTFTHPAETTTALGKEAEPCNSLVSREINNQEKEMEVGLEQTLPEILGTAQITQKDENKTIDGEDNERIGENNTSMDDTNGEFVFAPVFKNCSDISCSPPVFKLDNSSLVSTGTEEAIANQESKGFSPDKQTSQTDIISEEKTKQPKEQEEQDDINMNSEKNSNTSGDVCKNSSIQTEEGSDHKDAVQDEASESVPSFNVKVMSNPPHVKRCSDPSSSVSVRKFVSRLSERLDELNAKLKTGTSARGCHKRQPRDFKSVFEEFKIKHKEAEKISESGCREAVSSVNTSNSISQQSPDLRASYTTALSSRNNSQLSPNLVPASNSDHQICRSVESESKGVVLVPNNTALSLHNNSHFSPTLVPASNSNHQICRSVESESKRVVPVPHFLITDSSPQSPDFKIPSPSVQISPRCSQFSFGPVITTVSSQPISTQTQSVVHSRPDDSLLELNIDMSSGIISQQFPNTQPIVCTIESVSITQHCTQSHPSTQLFDSGTQLATDARTIMSTQPFSSEQPIQPSTCTVANSHPASSITGTFTSPQPLAPTQPFNAGTLQSFTSTQPFTIVQPYASTEPHTSSEPFYSTGTSFSTKSPINAELLPSTPPLEEGNVGGKDSKEQKVPQKLQTTQNEVRIVREIHGAREEVSVATEKNFVIWQSRSEIENKEYRAMRIKPVLVENSHELAIDREKHDAKQNISVREENVDRSQMAGIETDPAVVREKLLTKCSESGMVEEKHEVRQWEAIADKEKCNIGQRESAPRDKRHSKSTVPIAEEKQELQGQSIVNEENHVAVCSDSDSNQSIVEIVEDSCEIRRNDAVVGEGRIVMNQDKIVYEENDKMIQDTQGADEKERNARHGELRGKETLESKQSRPTGDERKGDSRQNELTRDERNFSAKEHESRSDEGNGDERRIEQGLDEESEGEERAGRSSKSGRSSKKRRRGHGAKHHHLQLQLSGKYLEMACVISSEGTKFLELLKEADLVGQNTHFSTLQPIHTRSLLAQMIKSRRVGEDGSNMYVQLLKLHGLVKTIDLLNHFGLDSALQCLTQFQTTHQVLISGCYKELCDELQTIQNSGTLIHPKIEILIREMERAKDRVDPNDSELKVLVVARRESQLVHQQLKEEKGIGSITLLTSPFNYDKVIHQLEEANVMVWEEGADLQQLPCSQFSLVVEWEDGGEPSPCVRQCLRQNINVVSLSIRTDEKDDGCKLNEDSDKEIGDSKSKKRRKTKNGREELTVIASTTVTTNTELHYILSSLFNIILVERSLRDMSGDGEGERAWPDLLLDERTCIILQPLSLLRSDTHVNHLICQLVLLTLQCTTCYVILYSHSPSNSEYVYRSTVLRSLTRLAALCTLLRSQDFSASLLLANSLHHVGSLVRRVSEATREISTVWDHEEWNTRPWLTSHMSSHERFLLSFPCINPISAQIMLTAMSLNDVLTQPLDKLSTDLPWIPKKVIKMMHEILHRDTESKTEIQVPSTSASASVDQDSKNELPSLIDPSDPSGAHPSTFTPHDYSGQAVYTQASTSGRMNVDVAPSHCQSHATQISNHSSIFPSADIKGYSTVSDPTNISSGYSNLYPSSHAPPYASYPETLQPTPFIVNNNDQFALPHTMTGASSSGIHSQHIPNNHNPVPSSSHAYQHHNGISQNYIDPTKTCGLIDSTKTSYELLDPTKSSYGPIDPTKTSYELLDPTKISYGPPLDPTKTSYGSSDPTKTPYEPLKSSLEPVVNSTGPYGAPIKAEDKWTDLFNPQTYLSSIQQKDSATESQPQRPQQHNHTTYSVPPYYHKPISEYPKIEVGSTVETPSRHLNSVVPQSYPYVDPNSQAHPSQYINPAQGTWGTSNYPTEIPQYSSNMEGKSNVYHPAVNNSDLYHAGSMEQHQVDSNGYWQIPGPSHHHSVPEPPTNRVFGVARPYQHQDVAMVPPSPRVILRQNERGHDFPPGYDPRTHHHSSGRGSTHDGRLAYERVPGRGGQTKLVYKRS